MQNTTTVVFGGRMPPFFGKVKAKHMWKQRRLNYGSFNMTVNALHKCKVMFESINLSDHFPKIDTKVDRHFNISQKLRAQIWCIKYICNPETWVLVYLCKNLLLGIFNRNPILRWFGEEKWGRVCREEVSFPAGLRVLMRLPSHRAKPSILQCTSFSVILIILLLRSYSGSKLIIHESSLLKCSGAYFPVPNSRDIKGQAKTWLDNIVMPKRYCYKLCYEYLQRYMDGTNVKRGQAKLVIILECELFRDPLGRKQCHQGTPGRGTLREKEEPFIVKVTGCWRTEKRSAWELREGDESPGDC